MIFFENDRSCIRLHSLPGCCNLTLSRGCCSCKTSSSISIHGEGIRWHEICCHSATNITWNNRGALHGDTALALPRFVFCWLWNHRKPQPARGVGLPSSRQTWWIYLLQQMSAYSQGLWLTPVAPRPPCIQLKKLLPLWYHHHLQNGLAEPQASTKPSFWQKPICQMARYW